MKQSESRTVRSGTSSDLRAIEAILVGLQWRENYVRGQMQSLEHLLEDPEAAVFVAEQDETVLAFVTVRFATWNRLGQLHGLAVHVGQRRGGLASLLVAAAEGWVRRQGGRGMYVDTPVSNDEGRLFYEANGYQFDYRMSHYYGDGLDGVTYLKLFEQVQ